MKVLPCPFCDGGDWSVSDDQGVISIRCDYCGALGPWANTVNRAKIFWNARIDNRAALKSSDAPKEG